MIEILRPGLFTTLQDRGRHGYAHLGVPVAGAADAFNLDIANRLVGNTAGAAALEMTGEGGVLRFHQGAFIALTGASLDALLDGEPVPGYQTVRAAAGAELHCGRMLRGWRSYCAVAGGIESPAVLGSRAGDTLAGLGPAPLVEGSRLQIGPAAAEPAFYFRAPPVYGEDVTGLRVLPGPHHEFFAPASLLALRESSYTVLPRSDRSGLRLEGAQLSRNREEEVPSMGMVTGAVQVPPAGQPLVLMANHGATGGYPVIANVITADLHLLAQLAPGSRLRFADASRAEALQALAQQRRRLADDCVPADAGLLAARALLMLAGKHRDLQDMSLSDGKRRIRLRR